MGKKLTNLNQYISVVTSIAKKWFVIFEHTVKQLSLDYVRLPNLNTIFLVLNLFSFFPSGAIYF